MRSLRPASIEKSSPGPINTRAELAPDVPPAVDHAAGDGGADRAPAPVIVAIVADAEGDALVNVGHRAHGGGRADVGGIGGAQQAQTMTDPQPPLTAIEIALGPIP